MKGKCRFGRTRFGLASLAFAFFASALAGCASQGLAGGVVAPEDPMAETAETNRVGLSPSPPGGAQIAELVKGNTRFALDLYRTLSADKANLVYSPYSLSAALAMTYAGTRGETEQQMAQALHVTLPQTQLHPAFNALDQALTRGRGRGDDGGFQLHMANGLWGQQGSSFQESFLDTLAKDYGTGLRTVDFEQAKEARRLINQWVGDQTEDRVRDLLPPGSVNAETALVLANAVYFRAAWIYPFVDSRTHDGVFTLPDGGQVTIPMMDQTAELGYAEGAGVQAIELPYTGGEIAMVILLPELGTFDQFAQGLDATGLNTILSGMERVGMRLAMPRFRFDGALEMKDSLMELGMVDAFGPADFSGMDGTRELFIDDVYHGALISVDEVGTEAVGSTAVVMQRKGELVVEHEVTVDRPFLFLIRDLDSGAILFLGHVVNPAA